MNAKTEARAVDIRPAPQPTHAGLPAVCYVDVTKLNLDGVTVVLIERGVPGYRPIPVDDVRGTAAAYVDYKNKSLGVSPAQREAMLVGSLVGWQVRGAKPEMYDKVGKWCYDAGEKGQGVISRGEMSEFNKHVKAPRT